MEVMHHEVASRVGADHDLAFAPLEIVPDRLLRGRADVLAWARRAGEVEGAHVPTFGAVFELHSRGLGCRWFSPPTLTTSSSRPMSARTADANTTLLGWGI
jgi:hypothetical protein